MKYLFDWTGGKFGIMMLILTKTKKVTVMLIAKKQIFIICLIYWRSFGLFLLIKGYISRMKRNVTKVMSLLYGSVVNLRLMLVKTKFVAQEIFFACFLVANLV